MQGCTKAYSSHDELLSRGIDLTQLIRGRQEKDEFAVEEASEEEEAEDIEGEKTEWERHC